MTLLEEATLLNRITTDAAILLGKPTIRGTRLSVEHLLKALSAGITFAALQEDYPFLEQEDVQACLLYASQLVENEKVYAIAS